MCVCVCVCVCRHLCMYVCVYVYIYIYIYSAICRLHKRLQIIQSQFTIAVTVFNGFMLKIGENMPVKEQVKAVQKLVNACHTPTNNCTKRWAFMSHTVSIILLGPSWSLVRFYSRRRNQDENTESEHWKICYSGCFCWDAIVSRTND